MKRGILWIVLIVLCALANAACSNTPSSHPPPPTLTVRITTAPASMVVGTTSNLVATVANDSMNGGVTWSCAPAASCGAASFNPGQTASGATSVFTAPATVPGGNQVTITAISVTNPAIVSAPVNITITAKPAITVTITAAPTTLVVGTTGNVTATVANDTANGGVTWNCAPAASCGPASFNPGQTASGVASIFTAPAAVPAGNQVTITATSVTNPAIVSAPVNITITATKPSITVTISSSPTTLVAGATGNVIATVANDTANGGVTWSCTPAASCGTTSFNPDQTASLAPSVFTAPATVPAGNQVTITATSVTNPAIVSAPVNITITAKPAITVTITTAPTTLAVGATGNVAATVANDTANGGVTWNCTPAASCGTTSFNPDQTASLAPSVFTAPATVPAGNQVTITATSVTNPAIVSDPVNITITAAVVPSKNFSFYVTGAENKGDRADYFLAGVVTIASDGSGTVLGGEQDYDDGDGILSPPQGDTITGGSLAITTGGTGTLTLITNNPAVGVGGTETFAVLFPNDNHAFITQFDGSATSSGSFDLQTSTTLPSGAFSFVLTGVHFGGLITASGGVFSVAAGNLTGTLDANVNGTVVLATTIPPPTDGPVTLLPPDPLGRGTFSGNTGIGTTLNYYVVSPKVIRIIQMDAQNTAVGSAYSQGAAPNFSSTSIGSSVFSVSNATLVYAAVGQFTTSGTTFTGVGDLNEIIGVTQLTAQPLGGTFALATNGYGSMTFAGGFGNIASFGLYAVDPTLNILDPNSTTGGLGGGLLAEMDSLAGTGSLVPQTDPAVLSFTGSYTFGGQGEIDSAGNFREFDFVGAGTMNSTSGAFAGTGDLNDPSGVFTGAAGQYTSVGFAATAVPDASHLGRYTLSPLALSNTFPASPIDLTVTAYQANGGQLFWLEVDPSTFFAGPLEQSSNPPSSPPSGAKSPAPKKQQH